MIAQIRGKLVEVEPLRAIVEAGGVGYALNIPVTTTERLPPVGKETVLYTHAVYREDAAELYGFATKEDRAFFQLLVTKVSGVGPRIALSILSKLSVSVLRGAIARGDAALLAKCPGIGKKTAERLIVELRDKVGAVAGTADGALVGGEPTAGVEGQGTRASSQEDAVSALVTLGYSASAADKAVRGAAQKLPPEATTEELIKLALR